MRSTLPGTSRPCLASVALVILAARPPQIQAFASGVNREGPFGSHLACGKVVLCHSRRVGWQGRTSIQFDHVEGLRVVEASCGTPGAPTPD